MAKFCRKKKIGPFIFFVGVGLVISVMFPPWFWIVVVGCGIVYYGYELMERNFNKWC